MSYTMYTCPCMKPVYPSEEDHNKSVCQCGTDLEEERKRVLEIDHTETWVAKWREILDIADAVVVNYVSADMVTGCDGNTGHEMVGVHRAGEGRWEVVSTRDLTEHDIVHELLHVAYPEVEDHGWIERMTELYTYGYVGS